MSEFSTGEMVFDVVGVKQVQTALREMTPLMKKHIVKAINTTLINIDKASKKKAPVGVSGQLRAGIHATFAKAGSKEPMGIVGSYAKHAAFQEFGTGQRGKWTFATSFGKAPPPWYQYGTSIKQPPTEDLVLWVIRKGLPKKFGMMKGKSRLQKLAASYGGASEKASATKYRETNAAYSIAFMIARSIKRKGGLKAKDYFYQAVTAETEPHLKRVEQAIIDSIKEASAKTAGVK